VPLPDAVADAVTVVALTTSMVTSIVVTTTVLLVVPVRPLLVSLALALSVTSEGYGVAAAV
jgi:hypothetical protein